MQPQQSYQVGCSHAGTASTPKNFIALDDKITVHNRLRIKVGRIPPREYTNARLHTPVLVELQTTGPIIVDKGATYKLANPRQKPIVVNDIPYDKDEFSLQIIDLPGVELCFQWIPLNITYTSLSLNLMHKKKKALWQGAVDFRVCKYNEPECTHMVVTDDVPLQLPISPKILWCLLVCVPIVCIEWVDLVLRQCITSTVIEKDWCLDDTVLRKYSPRKAFQVNPRRRSILVNLVFFTFHKDPWCGLIANMGGQVIEIDITQCTPDLADHQDKILHDVCALVQDVTSCFFLRVSPSYAPHLSNEFIMLANQVMASIASCFGTHLISTKQIETVVLDVDISAIIS